MPTPPPPHDVVVQVRAVTKRYTEGTRARVVLNAVDLDVARGTFFVLLGKSGSGKSTLLNVLSGVDLPDSGAVTIAGTNISALSERQRTLFRRDQIGIVFQFFNLVPTLTVLENVTLPLELRGTPRRQAAEPALALLARVGLADRASAFPDKLSGGEQQRVAIARALVTGPALVLADEPTGNLDDDTGRAVLSLLLDLTRGSGHTLVMATHNVEIVPLADQVGRFNHDGQLDVAPGQSLPTPPNAPAPATPQPDSLAAAR